VEDLRAIGTQYASVWHYIIQTVVSIRRNQLWRALHNLEEVRNRGLYLAGLRHGLIVSHFRQIDQLPESVRRSFARTLTSRVEASEIIRALKAAVACFYGELGLISVEGADFNVHKKVESEILALLDEFDR
jgi:hypothetical protein